LQCREAINYVWRTFGISSDLDDYECEISFSAKDDLVFHFQTAVGRRCIGTMLVKLAISDARYRRENEKAADKLVEASQKPRCDEDTPELELVELTPSKDPQERISPMGTHDDTLPAEIFPKSISPIRSVSSSDLQVLRKSAGTAREYTYLDNEGQCSNRRV
jgi:hypothetical protein